ncbi:cAMP-binding domain of CRP or a regulatory subunit of cAMP-dependent protein kinases [Chryseobacterium carnipullorum]|uniref:Crp/Fnr family transcriptional regulator n=1 Tax=Chryseobacterium carnipullorum TaxID=1124835 RepID=UPI00091FD0EF|nr:Crp/Fnr family transcriptional regulator [Chryseobacterium carnipullorum]SHM64923.1 cAMP-binding domain of CRP or a regulatory subunit of cAMP-dependent protein kinases [Chryseobacterium carnipullorum]
MDTSLRQIIKNTISISDDDLDFMASLFNPTALKKGDYFLEIGKRCDQIAFIKTGMLRIFYPNARGEETTCYFSLPNEFVTSFSSFTTQSLSTENIQAILPSELFVINKHDLEMLYQKIPAVQEFGRIAAENLAIIMEKRISLFLNNSADERYQFLLKNNPILIQKVPLQYLASYLGMSPQHLSRLRRGI